MQTLRYISLALFFSLAHELYGVWQLNNNIIGGMICENLVQSEILYNLSQSGKKIRQKSRASTRRARSLAKARCGDVLKPSKPCP